MLVGQKIKERRKQLGISADELAAVLNVSRSTIFRYENGDIEKLPASVLELIAKTLETTFQYLMGWTDDPYDYIADPEGRIANIPTAIFQSLYKKHNGNLNEIFKSYWDMDSEMLSEMINKEPATKTDDGLRGEFEQLYKGLSSEKREIILATMRAMQQGK